MRLKKGDKVVMTTLGKKHYPKKVKSFTGTVARDMTQDNYVCVQVDGYAHFRYAHRSFWKLKKE